MTTAANTNSNQNPSWQNPGGQNPGGQNPAWGRTAWSEPPFMHPYGLSRPLGIAMTILGFIFWWPVGLALLFYMIFSGRIGCRGARWMRGQGGQNGGQNHGNTWQSAPPPWASWCGGERKPASSGNHAFDDYRSETLRRLEEEQTEFSGFLERLRFAKDKAEFDQFMAERRPQAQSPPADPGQPSSIQPSQG